MLEFYNENKNRAYPFLEGQSLIPNSAIVSCGFSIGPGTGFAADVHNVTLTQISIVSNVFHFLFSCNAPGLVGYIVDFAVAADATDYKITYASTDVTSDYCEVSVLFDGFLVTGSLAELSEALVANNGPLVGAATVEPALITDISESFVNSIGIANGDRTRWTPRAGCPDPIIPFTPAPQYVGASCLTGPIRFHAGYNCAINQYSEANTITFAAAKGGGGGESCAEVPLFNAAIETLAWASTLDGSPRCHEVLRSINGVGGKNIDIIGGLGITVGHDNANSTVVVDIDTRGLAVCAEFTAPIPVEDCEEVTDLL